MDPTTIGLLSFGVMMILIILGVPIAFSMLATAAGGLYIIQGLCLRHQPDFIDLLGPGNEFRVHRRPDVLPHGTTGLPDKYRR